MNPALRTISPRQRPRHLLRVALATSLAAALAAGCSSMPERNGDLDAASSAYRTAQSDSKTSTLAPVELKEAGDALATATGAWERNRDTAETRHLAYLARQRVSIAEESATQRQAERALADASKRRDEIRLSARTAEVDVARAKAQNAQAQASAAQSQANAAQSQAAAAQARTDVANEQARTAQAQKADADARNAQLVAMMNELNAKQTDRGFVVTLGDVLFDTAQAELRPSGMRSMDKLSAFLTQYPERSVMIEGFTDSVGSSAANQSLSTRRAESVRAALQSRGVAGGRISAVGHGEAYPVAGNEAPQGRQQNRRVEIVLSDASGVVKAR